MSRTYRRGDRRIRVRGVRRPTDLRRLARVLIELEQAEAEAAAEAEHQAQTKIKQAKPPLAKRRTGADTNEETAA
jgi:hypothetical protein